jgi:16S rRNA (guanine966-N2)-methyltransferase
MRIVAGEFKGRAIKSPDEKTTRPTTDRVRESMYSSVYSRIPDLAGICVLDAFAGSGALGIEALSRGASSCTFFENDRDARRVLQSNLDSLGLSTTRACVRGIDSFACPSGEGPFGLVMLDPPYAHEPSELHTLLKSLSAHGELEDSCVIVYEHALANRQAVADEFAEDDAFVLTGQKKYGKIGVTYMRYDKREE